LPEEAGEAFKAFISADEDGAVFDGEGGEPGVVEVVALQVERFGETAKGGGVGIAGGGAEGAGVGEQALPVVENDWAGSDAVAWVSTDAEKGKFVDLGEERFGSGAGKCFEPGAAGCVGRGFDAEGVEKDVGVRQVAKHREGRARARRRAMIFAAEFGEVMGFVCFAGEAGEVVGREGEGSAGGVNSEGVSGGGGGGLAKALGDGLLDKVGEGNAFAGGLGFGGAIEAVVESKRGLNGRNVKV